MTDTYTAELRDIIDRAFTAEHGGRATAQMVHTTVYRDLPEHLVDFLIGKGIRSQIAAYFREKNSDGLPKRPEVNDEGEHGQLALLTVAECMHVYSRYVSRAEANSQQAERLREFCIAQHGVDVAAEQVSA